MNVYVFWLMIALMLATAAALVMGLITMVRGKGIGQLTSNRLMQWRVGLQALALLAFATLLWLR